MQLNYCNALGVPTDAVQCQLHLSSLSLSGLMSRFTLQCTTALHDTITNCSALPVSGVHNYQLHCTPNSNTQLLHSQLHCNALPVSGPMSLFAVQCTVQLLQCIALMHCSALSLSGLMTLFMRPNQSRCSPLLPKLLTKIIIIIIIISFSIIIIITRPRPAFGRLGLGGSSGGYSPPG